MSRVETASNVAVILAAAVVIGNNIYGRFVTHVPNRELAISRELTGKSLALPASLPIGRQGTVTMFVSSDCHYCRESVDFYGRLASLMHGDNSCDVKLVAVGPSRREKRDGIQAFLTDQHLKVDGADVVDFTSLGISSTPTLVLRDSSQLVSKVWVGLLPATREKEVFERVQALCRH